MRELLARFELFVDYALHILNQSPMTVRWYRDAMRNYTKFLRLGSRFLRNRSGCASTTSTGGCAGISTYPAVGCWAILAAIHHSYEERSWLDCR